MLPPPGVRLLVIVPVLAFLLVLSCKPGGLGNLLPARSTPWRHCPEQVPSLHTQHTMHNNETIQAIKDQAEECF